MNSVGGYTAMLPLQTEDLWYLLQSSDGTVKQTNRRIQGKTSQGKKRKVTLQNQRTKHVKRRLTVFFVGLCIH